MMSVKSMLFSRMMSLYISTNESAMKSTKWLEETALAAQMTSQTANTSSYTNSKDLKHNSGERLQFSCFHVYTMHNLGSLY